ncbi:MAG: molybdopterin molybdotransferase MoeA [Acidilobaceae archaeon]|nr:molybdopterin molybdotransferase MoeA [Acidilobaceae archaeon]MCX8165906.1 molybdopterin molybdotransferase MoeA [Acidilobaceae archaeon]MDW7974548.1 molybdopterin molybdotransferase MoeA [Sulfolobales archaeon]
MELLDPSQAIEKVRRAVGRRIADSLLEDSEEVPISALRGRLLAEDIRAPISLPPLPRSTLDGYAVSLLDLASSPNGRKPLKLAFRQAIGEGIPPRLGEGECAYVDTGSIVPPGAEAVVPVENAEVTGDSVVIKDVPSLGDGIALPATDVSSGDVVLHRGSRITAVTVASLASLGIDRVLASRRPRVAVLSIGRELLEPGGLLEAGKTYDANRYYIASVMSSLGYEIIDLGIVGDTEGEVERALERAKGSDIVITSGSTSLGTGDVVPKVLDAMGQVLVRGLRVKPGKPTTVGIVGGRLVIGLPGNPRAAVNVVNSFVMGLLDSLGLPAAVEERSVEVTLATSVRLDPRRRLYLPLATVRTTEGLLGYPVAVESYSIASLPKANAHSTIESGRLLGALSKVRAQEFQAPEETVVSLVDTKLIGLPQQGIKVVYPMGKERFNTVSVLRGSGSLLISSSRAGYVGEVLEEVERKILLVGRGDCRLAAVYDVYSELYRGRKMEVPRAETAKILYELSYVDCAVVPEEYSPHEGIVLEREKVYLARL